MADVISEACFLAMSPEIALMSMMDHSTMAVALTVMICINFNSYSSLVVFFIIPVWFCFVFKHEIIHTIRVSAEVEVLLPCVILRSN